MTCSGETAALEAGSHDLCTCVDCNRQFPGGEMREYPHGNVCKGCHEEREADVTEGEK